MPDSNERWFGFACEFPGIIVPEEFYKKQICKLETIECRLLFLENYCEFSNDELLWSFPPGWGINANLEIDTHPSVEQKSFNINLSFPSGHDVEPGPIMI